MDKRKQWRLVELVALVLTAFLIPLVFFIASIRITGAAIKKEKDFDRMADRMEEDLIELSPIMAAVLIMYFGWVIWFAVRAWKRKP